MLGVFFQHATPEHPADPAVTKLLKHIEDTGKAKDKVTVDAGSLWDPTAGYFQWTGSLTTPPCSGGVYWLLQATPRRVAAEQVAAFTKHEGGYPGNARPTQPLNGRRVRVHEPTGGAA